MVSSQSSRNGGDGLSGNGSVDTWEYYEAGVLNRIGTDNDGDGEVDRWEQKAAAAEAATTAG
jgi:hypothetical protein